MTRQFIPLSDYQTPALATEASLRRLLRDASRVVSRKTDDPVMAADRMRRTAEGILDDLAPPPVCAPLMKEMDDTFLGWTGTPVPDAWLRLVVLPPGDPDRLVETWARRNGHRVVDPPLRSDLVTTGAPGLATLRNLDPKGQGVLVIPRLERWFLRHRNGLGHLRGLLDWLGGLERHCLIGCDSWAWSFAQKAASAETRLPAPQTFAPFDAARLHAWFDALREEEGETRVFRLAATGEDVFATDGDGTPECNWFTNLAARSHGIPWVAWAFWRHSLRYGLEKDDGEEPPQDAAPAGEDTLWIVEPKERTVPVQSDRAATLILQALLLHGPLTMAELDAVLPMPHLVDGIPALVTAGLMRREGDTLLIVPAAYPEIREAIAADGIARNVV